MIELDYVFWPAPVRLHPFETHVRAAAAGGFTSLAITATTYADARKRSMSNADIVGFAADHGVLLRHLDTLTTWAPNQLSPDDFDAEMNERWATTIEYGLEMCAELGLKQILATAAYLPNAVPLGQLIEGFGRLCEEANKIGVWVDLEPMPFFGCNNVAAAWSVVGGAAQENSGILLDTWHFYKAGDQTLEVIDPIPGKYFRTMQVNDAPLAQITPKLIDDTIMYRRWPGQGELPVQEFVRKVFEKGGLKAVGQEVFSLEADAMDPDEAGRIAGRTTWAMLESVGIPTPSQTTSAA